MTIVCLSFCNESRLISVAALLAIFLITNANKPKACPYIFDAELDSTPVCRYNHLFTFRESCLYGIGKWRMPSLNGATSYG